MECLTKSERQLRSLYSSMNEGICIHTMVYDKDGTAVDYLIDAVNPRYEEILGLRREDVEGRLASAGYKADTPPFLDSYEFTAKTGTPVHFETYFFPMEKYFSISVFSIEQGTFATVFDDITERKRSENSMEQANRKLELLSSITRHDIRNKVSIISGYLDIISEEDISPGIKVHLDNIASAASSIRAQIDFSEMYDGIGSSSPNWQVVSTIIGSLRPPPGIQLQENAGDVQIYADPMLGMVFSNLLDNTLKHARGARSIRVYSARDPSGIVLFWEDDGPGIPYEEKEKIFCRGYGGNTGMGLFLAREILGITGLEIRETGTPGVGARFEIHVPDNAYRIV